MLKSVKIASVHFWPMVAKRNYFPEGYQIAAYDPAVDDEPQIVEVKSLIEAEDGPYGGNNERLKRESLVDAMEIANCIIREWTTTGIYMSPSAHPGIWIVREYAPLRNGSGDYLFGLDKKQEYGEVSASDKAKFMSADMANAMERDEEYARALIDKALMIHAAPKEHAGTPISKPMRAAVKRYIPQDQWPEFMYKRNLEATKPCDYCKKKISSDSITCPFCQQIVDAKAFYARKLQDSEIEREYQQLIAAETLPVRA